MKIMQAFNPSANQTPQAGSDDHHFWGRLWSLQTGLPLLVLAVLLVIPLGVHNDYFIQLLIVSLFGGAQAMVSDFTVGFINISNFGFAAFVGLGAYTSALLVNNLGVSPLIGILAGCIASGLLGTFTGLLTMRLRGLYVAVTAWFVAMALQALATVLVNVTRGPMGLVVPPLTAGSSLLPYYFLLLLITVIVYVVIRALVRSKVGLAFRAIGQDVEYARASGINPTRYKMIAFTLSCAFAGLLGGFYAHFVGILTPDLMGTQHTVEVLALNIIGGRGSIWGPLLAGFLMIPALETMKSLMEIRLIIYGALLVGFMVFYPSGLAGLIMSAIERRRKSKAGRDVTR